MSNCNNTIRIVNFAKPLRILCMIKSISPCPIIEANIQINCTFMVDQDVIVGLIYSLLHETDGRKLNIEKLPILNLPEQIRCTDPNLKDKPWYKINCGEFFIMVGLFGIAFGVTPPYSGWDKFHNFATQVFNELNGRVIKGISSITLKYLNFFSETNIFENINCSICLNGNPVTAIPTIFRTELPESKFIKVFQITNGAHLQNHALNIDNDGSLIEISIFTRNVSVDNFNNVLEDAHICQKKSFFELLSNEYLATFRIENEQEYN